MVGTIRSLGVKGYAWVSRTDSGGGGGGEDVFLHLTQLRGVRTPGGGTSEASKARALVPGRTRIEFSLARGVGACSRPQAIDAVVLQQ